MFNEIAQLQSLDEMQDVHAALPQPSQGIPNAKQPTVPYTGRSKKSLRRLIQEGDGIQEVNLKLLYTP